MRFYHIIHHKHRRATRRALAALLAALLGCAGAVAEQTPSAEPTPIIEDEAWMDGDAAALRIAQRKLIELSLLAGSADGVYGPKTEAALRAYQEQNGLEASGHLDAATYEALTHVDPATATDKDVQQRLIDLGYLAGKASGKVDGITEQAIVAFQRRNGLDDDGVAGPGTLEKLYSSSARKASSAVGVIGTTLEVGDEGTAVRLLQSRLKTLGYLGSTVDGSFGAATQDAVKAFQRDNGLTADGKAGYSTLQKLFAGTVKNASGKTEAASAKATATPEPNTYVRVTKAPDGSYVTLEKGTMGTLVTKLQRALKNAGYFKGTVDGYYGEDTVTAVRNFQRDKGLIQDGKAGPATQRYLFEGDFPNES